MATPQFGVLKPLKQYKRQQQHQQQHQQQQRQQHQQQPHYSQFRFQQNAQIPASPAPSLAPLSRNHQQHQQPQRREQQQQEQQQEESQHGKQQNDSQHADTRQQGVAPVASSNHNGDIHTHLQLQPRSPVLNDIVASPPQPQQQQQQFQIMASVSASFPTSTSNPASINPPAMEMASTTPSTDTPALLDSQHRHRTPTRPSKRRRSDNGADPPLSSHVPPQPPTAHPLNKGPYNTLEDAIFSLQLHVFTSGYGVSQKRTVKEKLPSGKYDPDGDVIRKDFVCDKGGNEFVSQSRGERRRESKKCGCPWKAAVRRLRREGDRWFIEILETHHNHPVTSPDEMHSLASYRRWQRENNAGIRSAIARLTRAAAMPARDIAAYLKGGIQDHDLDRIDKQILRALSMNDKEAPGIEKDGGSVIFEMVARRPVIILQDTGGASTISATVNGHLNATIQSPSMTGSLNQTTPTLPPNQSTPTYHHTFSNTFAQTSHPHPHPHPNSNPLAPASGGGSTASMHSGYPAIS
ncbi:hypothetical protein F4861DRAFT_518582 [Xylaria intraflava]|nr:hypothetical protein F4861DRAFT_518582 [Xylaria intraflava]